MLVGKAWKNWEPEVLAKKLQEGKTKMGQPKPAQVTFIPGILIHKALQGLPYLSEWCYQHQTLKSETSEAGSSSLSLPTLIHFSQLFFQNGPWSLLFSIITAITLSRPLALPTGRLIGLPAFIWASYDSIFTLWLQCTFLNTHLLMFYTYSAPWLQFKTHNTSCLINKILFTA